LKITEEFNKCRSVVFTVMRTISFKIMDVFRNLKISTKIMMFFLAILISSILLSSFLYMRMNAKIMSDKVSEVSMQVLTSINTNIESNIAVIGSYSTMILSDNSLQDFLAKGINYDDYAKIIVDRKMNSFLGANPVVSSMYIFDNSGTMLSYDRVREKKLKYQKLEEYSWYKSMVAGDGEYILNLTAGNTFVLDKNENYISLIRQIKDINTLKPIGVLIVNISTDYLQNSFNAIEYQYGTDIAVFDGKNNCIIPFKKKETSLIVNSEKGESSLDVGTKIAKIQNVDYMISNYNNSEKSMKIVSVMPFTEVAKESSAFGGIALIMVLINSFLLIIGSVMLSRVISKPIKKLIASMKVVENGVFEQVSIKTGNDEIGKLKDCYNYMINEIQKLIKRLVDEQKIIRKTELGILQAQIKPHFLYNTLETARSFALTGMSEKVNLVLKALENYYRYSLSKGKDIITIQEEIEIVRNYLTIQKYRYGDTITDIYEIDELVVGCKIPKLVLQPLVENSIYHGIRPSGESGIIKIKAYRQNDSTVLSVEDNGVGMDSAQIEEFMGIQPDGDKKGFGLWGTIERLRIFYGVEDVLAIESKKYEGTKITITIMDERSAGIDGNE